MPNSRVHYYQEPNSTLNAAAAASSPTNKCSHLSPAYTTSVWKPRKSISRCTTWSAICPSQRVLIKNMDFLITRHAPTRHNYLITIVASAVARLDTDSDLRFRSHVCPPSSGRQRSTRWFDAREWAGSRLGDVRAGNRGDCTECTFPTDHTQTNGPTTRGSS